MNSPSSIYISTPSISSIYISQEWMKDSVSFHLTFMLCNRPSITHSLGRAHFIIPGYHIRQSLFKGSPEASGQFQNHSFVGALRGLITVRSVCSRSCPNSFMLCARSMNDQIPDRVWPILSSSFLKLSTPFWFFNGQYLFYLNQYNIAEHRFSPGCYGSERVLCSPTLRGSPPKRCGNQSFTQSDSPLRGPSLTRRGHEFDFSLVPTMILVLGHSEGAPKHCGADHVITYII